MVGQHSNAKRQSSGLLSAAAVYLVAGMVHYSPMVIAGGVTMAVVGAELYRRAHAQDGDKR